MTGESSRRLLLVGEASPLPSSVDIVTDVLTQARARGIRTHLINRGSAPQPAYGDRTIGKEQ